MKNCIKQMCRTPMQLLLIIVLIMIVTAMLVVGGNLWFASERLSRAYMEDFITIGTVTQKPDLIVEGKTWDAEKGDYRFFKAGRYDRYVTEEDLKFPGVEYIVEPEKRVYWGSYAPEYIHVSETVKVPGSSLMDVVEFSPLEDCVPNQSVKIKITKVLSKDKTMEGSVVWFCDHDNRYPDELKADKTYVASLEMTAYAHGEKWDENQNNSVTVEYGPIPLYVTLYTKEGERIDDPYDIQEIYEVSEGFYDTHIGQRFLTWIDVDDAFWKTQPVVGTNSTDLLMPFYEGSAWLSEGRFPTGEEYEQGTPVCLAPRTFAENNHLSVGDTVMTRLYFTDARLTPDINFRLNGGGGLGVTMLDLDGNLLKPFEEKEYMIIGLYDLLPSASGIGADELIVPLNSVHNKMENIVSFGAMTDDNTSFQIENGSIAEFIEISAKQDTENLIFTFYDRGYSALIEGIENLRNMSLTLLITGVIAAVVLTLQISHIYITKQKKRLAIERLLGMTGKRCRNICLAGILFLMVVGTIPGIAAGTVILDHINIEDMRDEDFNRKYSNLGLSANVDIDIKGDQKDPVVSCMMGGLVLVLGVGTSGYRIHQILGKEPLYLVEDSKRI